MFVLFHIAWLTEQPQDDTLLLTSFVDSVYSVKQCQDLQYQSTKSGLYVDLLAPPYFHKQ